MFRRFFLSIILIGLLTSCIFFGAWFSFILTPLVSEPAGLRYQVHPGTSFKVLTQNLYDQGLVKHPLFFNLLACLHGNRNELKAGIYLVPRGTTPGRLLGQLTTGTGLLYHVFTLIPGWDFQQLRAALARENTLQSTLQGKSEAEVMALLGVPHAPEGQFFPDSYYYLEGTSDLNLLRRAYKRMQGKLQAAWLRRDLTVAFQTPYEALIAASLVEKEAHFGAERPVIAGVLLNRLAMKMPLQFDTTLIYGLHQREQTHHRISPGFSGVIRKQDLQWDTSYNTYLHRGLPPTPIAMPSADSLNAVLHPVKHHYFYFVATGFGGHQFSTTLEEHHLAVLMLRFHEQGFFNVTWTQAYLLRQLSFRERRHVLW